MSYNAFLRVMCQLASKHAANIEFDNKVIFFNGTSSKDRLVIKTQVYNGNGYLPSSVLSCVSSGGAFRWQNQGAYLQLDTEAQAVYLIEEIKLEQGKYISFKNILLNFSSSADEWKEILNAFAGEDYYPISS